MRTLRKVLIGLVIVAVIFLAGFLTDHFIRYSPLSEELEKTQAELEQANQELSDLQDENDRLTSANETALDEIADLEADLTDATANLKFFQVLVNVNTARLELFLENIEGAQAALVDTQDNLEDLLPYIEEVDAELALSLPRRLELILSGLERDPETALIDLELLTKDLLELEPLLVVD
jgi:chromosome segregation ATPase